MRHLAQRVIHVLDSKPPRGARGQSLVELAFTTPFLLIMVIGIVEIGFLANNYLVLLDAAREGGRYASSLNPLTWAVDASQVDGDPLTRTYQRADCELLSNDPSPGSSYRINNSTLDAAHGVVVAPLPHPDIATAPYTNGTESKNFGFFDAVACQTVASMDPLWFDYKYDDVVVSVITYANRCPGWVNNGNPDITQQAACYDATSTVRQPRGRKIVITGRFPLANRRCNGQDKRDPFQVPFQTQSNTTTAGNAFSPVVRGFTLTGHQKATNDCYGSRFFLDEDSPLGEYNLDTVFNSLPNTVMQQNVLSGAATIIEIYYNHHQLLNFPGFNLLNDPVSGGIHLSPFMIFPTNAAAPTPTNAP